MEKIRITLRYTTLDHNYSYSYITLHNATQTRLHYTHYSYSYNYNYTTLDHTTEHNTTAHYSILLYITPHSLHHTTTITATTTTLHILHYTTTTTPLHYNYNSSTLQLQLQLRYATLHPAVVGEVATATIAATPRNTTPTTFRSISGFALPSMHHRNSPPL